MNGIWKRYRGFSLLELMVTLTVLAILLIVAVPSLRGVINRNQVSSSSNALLASLAYARTEAINRGQLVSICPTTTGTACTAGGHAYDPGWIVYTYPAGAASANQAYSTTAATLLRATGARSGVSIWSKGTTVITFDQQGQVQPGTKLVFMTCYRNGSSGTGISTTAVPGVELDVNYSGSVTTSTLATGASCTPT